MTLYYIRELVDTENMIFQVQERSVEYFGGIQKEYEEVRVGILTTEQLQRRSTNLAVVVALDQQYKDAVSQIHLRIPDARSRQSIIPRRTLVPFEAAPDTWELLSLLRALVIPEVKQLSRDGEALSQKFATDREETAAAYTAWFDPYEATLTRAAEVENDPNVRQIREAMQRMKRMRPLFEEDTQAQNIYDRTNIEFANLLEELTSEQARPVDQIRRDTRALDREADELMKVQWRRVMIRDVLIQETDLKAVLLRVRNFDTHFSKELDAVAEEARPMLEAARALVGDDPTSALAQALKVDLRANAHIRYEEDKHKTSVASAATWADRVERKMPDWRMIRDKSLEELRADIVVVVRQERQTLTDLYERFISAIDGDSERNVIRIQAAYKLLLAQITGELGPAFESAAAEREEVQELQAAIGNSIGLLTARASQLTADSKTFGLRLNKNSAQLVGMLPGELTAWRSQVEREYAQYLEEAELRDWIQGVLNMNMLYAEFQRPDVTVAELQTFQVSQVQQFNTFLEAGRARLNTVSAQEQASYKNRLAMVDHMDEMLAASSQWTEETRDLQPPPVLDVLREPGSSEQVNEWFRALADGEDFFFANDVIMVLDGQAVQQAKSELVEATRGRFIPAFRAIEQNRVLARELQEQVSDEWTSKTSVNIDFEQLYQDFLVNRETFTGNSARYTDLFAQFENWRTETVPRTYALMADAVRRREQVGNVDQLWNRWLKQQDADIAAGNGRQLILDQIQGRRITRDDKVRARALFSEILRKGHPEMSTVRAWRSAQARHHEEILGLPPQRREPILTEFEQQIFDAVIQVEGVTRDPAQGASKSIDTFPKFFLDQIPAMRELFNQVDEILRTGGDVEFRASLPREGGVLSRIQNILST